MKFHIHIYAKCVFWKHRIVKTNKQTKQKVTKPNKNPEPTITTSNNTNFHQAHKIFIRRVMKNTGDLERNFFQLFGL